MILYLVFDEFTQLGNINLKKLKIYKYLPNRVNSQIILSEIIKCSNGNLLYDGYKEKIDINLIYYKIIDMPEYNEQIYFLLNEFYDEYSYSNVIYTLNYFFNYDELIDLSKEKFTESLEWSDHHHQEIILNNFINKFEQTNSIEINGKYEEYNINFLEMFKVNISY